MATEFQNQIDSLIEEVILTGELIVDEHVTCTVFKIIEKNKNILYMYNQLISSRRPLCIDDNNARDSVNNQVGKRVQVKFNKTPMATLSAFGKTNLIKFYRLLI